MKKKTKKKVVEKLYFPTINIIMLTFVLIASNVLIYFSLDIFGYSILTSVLVFPFVYFFINRILVKSNMKIAVFAIITSIIAQSLVFIITHFLTASELDLYKCFGSLISYTITILINIFLYNKYFIKKESGILKLFLLYTGIIFIDSFLFLLIFNKGTFDGFDMVFLISTGIKAIIGLLLGYLETCFK